MEQKFRSIYLLGMLAYLILIVFSVVFYQERTIFTDIAYHLFSIIQSGGFAIQNFRFVAICTQVLPLFALKAHLSLQAITLAYSVAFSLFYFFCYCFIGIVQKNYCIALCLLFCNVLFVSHTFYWIQSELPQTLAVIMLIWSTLININIDRPKPFALAMIFFGLFAVAFSHPLAMFAFVYTVLFFYLDKRKLVSANLLVTTLIFYGAMLVVKNVVFKTQYETAAMGGVKKIFTTFPHYIKLYANKRFLVNCIRLYYWLPILGAVVIAFYLVKREYKKFLLFTGASGGYFLLINVSYPNIDTTVFYMENMYLPLALFVAFPVFYDILMEVRNKKITILTVGLIALTGCIRIYATHTSYTRRLAWEQSFLAKNAQKKLVIDSRMMPKDTLFMTWGTPYEFWLLSSIENNQTASIIINENPEQFAEVMGKKNIFLTTWGNFSYNDLPKKYFMFRDSTNGYNILKQ